MYAWDQNQGIPEGQNETDQQYERFHRFLREPRPRRLTRIAETFGVSLPNISALAKRRNWEERSKAFDEYQERWLPLNQSSNFRSPKPPPEPPEPDDGSIVPEVVNDRRPDPPPPVAVIVDASAIRAPGDGGSPEVILPLQRGSLAAQEEYRVAILALGKRQLKSAKGLNDAFVRLSSHVLDLVTRLGEISAKAKADPDAPAEMVAALQKLENAVENQLATATMSLQRLASASTAMGTQGRENWGQAVGVEVLLERLEAMLAMQEDLGYTQKTPPALPEGANQQEPNDDHQ